MLYVLVAFVFETAFGKKILFLKSEYLIVLSAMLSNGNPKMQLL